MWKCEFTGQPARGPIRVDGSDRCFCSPCQSAIRVEQAIGTADATAEAINMALSYLGVWNDPAEAVRLLKLARKNVGEISHTMRQARGERQDELYAPDPDWAEDDAANAKPL